MGLNTCIEIEKDVLFNDILNFISFNNKSLWKVNQIKWKKQSDNDNEQLVQRPRQTLTIVLCDNYLAL